MMLLKFYLFILQVLMIKTDKFLVKLLGHDGKIGFLAQNVVSPNWLTTNVLGVGF
jgi:hypothetical protein